MLEGIRRQAQVRVVGLESVDGERLVAPLEGLAQAIRGVLQNALDASAEGQPVEMHVQRDGPWLQLRITDQGGGMPPEVLAASEASCVSILKQHGALVLGKTVTTEFAYFEPGPTRNPHNLAHAQ